MLQIVCLRLYQGSYARSAEHVRRRVQRLSDDSPLHGKPFCSAARLLQLALGAALLVCVWLHTDTGGGAYTCAMFRLCGNSKRFSAMHLC